MGNENEMENGKLNNGIKRKFSCAILKRVYSTSQVTLIYVTN